MRLSNDKTHKILTSPPQGEGLGVQGPDTRQRTTSQHADKAPQGCCANQPFTSVNSMVKKQVTRAFAGQISG